MSDTYCYLHLRTPARDWHELLDALKTTTFALWRQSGIEVWGVWHGLFGVASNELIVMAAARDELPAQAFTGALPDGVDVRHAELLESTVRPVDTAPCERPGVYVFRFFEVGNADVDAIVQLSREAWTTFENTDAYAAEPQGLFAQHDRRSERGRMLLVTWYDGLESWQTSRTPSPAARENFQRRQALVSRTVALATRLVTQTAD
jgi:hypothetical protein